VRVGRVAVGDRWEADLGCQCHIARQLLPQVVKVIDVVPGVGAGAGERVGVARGAVRAVPPGVTSPTSACAANSPSSALFCAARAAAAAYSASPSALSIAIDRTVRFIGM
jgi:hypothetical protein